MRYFRRTTQLLQQHLFFGLLAAGLLLVWPALTLATPGDLDPTFGIGGKVITNLPHSDFLLYPAKMVIQPDGKIVVQGRFDGDTSDSFLARYNPDGTLDNSFGINGMVLRSFQVSFESFSYGLAILPDGKILVSGFAASANDGLAVFRFNSDGSRDTSFGVNGVAGTRQVGGLLNYSRTLVVQPDGKSIVIGNLYDSDDTTPAGMGMERFNPDGSLDVSFGTNGTLVIPSTTVTRFEVDDAAVLPDGKLLLIGVGYYQDTGKVLLSRINANGTLDASFGANGILLLESNVGLHKFAVQPDGKIVFPLYSFTGDAPPTIVRLNPNGTFDASFGTNGKVFISDSEGSFDNSVLIQPNGKILAAGYAYMGNLSRFAIVRLNADGSRDTTFGSNGIVTTLLASDVNQINDLALQPDGKLVAYGIVSNAPPFKINIGLARYVLDSPRPNDIDDQQFFVRQHYLDFLAREPEQSGLDAWLRVLRNCPGGDAECLHQARLTTSAAFFGSEEFQLKGYFVFRFYSLAFDRLPTFAEISADMQDVSGSTPAEVYAHKATFTDTFAQRSEFAARFAALSNANYVTALLSRYGLTGITTPDPAQPDGAAKVTLTPADLVARLDNNSLSRVQVLRAIADSDEVFQLEFNRAFVAMQYYGYLRRAPEAGGYNAWLTYLNAHPTDSRTMVRGFVDSIEYRMRFGQP